MPNFRLPLPGRFAGRFGAVELSRDVAPMSDINTTPLIDVMLVLLIMFIITVPVQSHKVALDLPVGPPGMVDRLKNQLSLSENGALTWNGMAVNDRQLAALMAAVARMPDQPEVHFQPDPAARYERVDQVLAIAAQSGADRFGFKGNERYRESF